MSSHQHHNHASHHHGTTTFNRAFLIAILANAMFVILQIIFSFTANSMSLLADAIHNLGDVLGLVLSWLAYRLLKKQPTEKTTYGLKKTSILAALANGIMLVFTCGIIVTEAMYKLFSPTAVHTVSVMIVATIGIVVNGSTAMLFLRNSNDLNIRAAFLHLFYDALISVGVVVSAIIIYWTNWLWIDPIVGLIIALIIIKGTWSLFRDSFRLIIDGVPRNVSWQAILSLLQSVEGVEQVHDLHIWALSTQENALSVHLYMPNKLLSDEARQQLVQLLKDKYAIHHTTIQVEQDLSFCEDACTDSLQNSCY